jgi:anaerobic selenocysteine-containing dehydrogenase
VPGRERVSFWWTMGVNQSHQAVRTAQAIINLALMTGNIGRPGTGANSITGQCNAMGSRLFSNTTNLLGGHDFKNPEHRAKVARVLDIPVERIPDQPSFAYDQILEAVERGEIRALWIVCTNPAHSWMHRGRFDELRRKLDFLVVQDMYATTETARIADLVLPAAGWGEKEGVFINSERRIGYSPKASRAPGEALSDFSIFRLLAHSWGCGEMFARWQCPEDVFHSLRELSRGQPCEISGITGYDMLMECGGVQWPWKESEAGRPAPHRRLFADGRFFTPDGRARFCFDASQPVPEPVDAEYPFVLITGRGTSAQWHTETRTRASKVLHKLHPRETPCTIHPDDAIAAGIVSGQRLSIRSRRGGMTARASISGTVARGQLFVPMHDADVNLLTLWQVDPHSRQPSYKHCAVKIAAG